MTHDPTSPGPLPSRGAPTSGDDTPLLVEATLRLEEARGLDRIVKTIEPFAQKLIADPMRRAILHGKPLGHAVHPILTDLPLGAWISASVLDLTAGKAGRPAAERLVAFGLLTAGPTAVTGWAEWAVGDAKTKRVGVVHAGGNVLAVVIYGASWLARRRGHHVKGAALALVGSAGLMVSGYLGGHMALARKHATHDPSITPAQPS